MRCWLQFSGILLETAVADFEIPFVFITFSVMANDMPRAGGVQSGFSCGLMNSNVAAVVLFSSVNPSPSLGTSIIIALLLQVSTEGSHVHSDRICVLDSQKSSLIMSQCKTTTRVRGFARPRIFFVASSGSRSGPEWGVGSSGIWSMYSASAPQITTAVPSTDIFANQRTAFSKSCVKRVIIYVEPRK
jgi:hypothetical protein